MIKIHAFNQNNKLFILGILIQHGATHHLWIFNVQCSFSMAYLTISQHISTPKQTLSSPPPQNKNACIHSVIF